MSKSILSEAAFHSEQAAYRFVEAHIWPDGPVCFHCGATKKHVGKLKGKSTRIGLYKCYACRKPFTVKMGTVLESSHVPMRMWLQAIYLLFASPPGFRVRRGPFIVRSSGGISIRQLQGTLGVGLKTAWFMSGRIREAMKRPDRRPPGGQSRVVVANETDRILLMLRGIRAEKPRRPDDRRLFTTKSKFDNPAQSKRFIDMAREVGADESKDVLERAFARGGADEG
jgi:transposase-like protein